MNLRTVKNPTDMKLDGIAFDCEFRDKTLAAVTMTDHAGHLVRFVLENYSVRALVPAEPEKKTVHVVTGKVRVLGTDIREEFEDSYNANLRKHELEDARVVDEAAVAVEEIDVLF